MNVGFKKNVNSDKNVSLFWFKIPEVQSLQGRKPHILYVGEQINLQLLGK